MNKYTELSDFEINKKIAESCKLNVVIFEHTKIVIFDDMNATPFDPCNNPADAMPIITENKISMNFINDNIGWAAIYRREEKEVLETSGNNYYRTAMIYFLLIKDTENEKV